MRKEYVPPTEADIAGADALIVAVPPGIGVTAPEWAPLTHMLGLAPRTGAWEGRGRVPGGDAAANAAFASDPRHLGFVMVPSTRLRRPRRPAAWRTRRRTDGWWRKPAGR